MSTSRDTGRVLYMRDEGSHDDALDDSALIHFYDSTMASARRELGLSVADNQSNTERRRKPKHTWSAGDACVTRYTVDGVQYEADIVELLEDDKCEVEYVGYKNREIVNLSSLRRSRGEKARGQQLQDAACYEENQEVSDSEDGEVRGRTSSVQQSKSRGENGSDLPQSDTADCRRGKFSADTCRPRADTCRPRADTCRPRAAIPPVSCTNCHIRSPHSSPRIAPPPPPPILPGGDHDEALANMLMSWYLSGYHTGYYAGCNDAKHGRPC